MRVRTAILGCVCAAITAVSLVAQAPTESSIVAPYAALQNQVQIGGHTYPIGSVNYGPAGTPLTINGSNFGSSATVTFNGTAVSVTPTTSSKISVSVPSGATSGLVLVTTSGGSSAGLPFLVTPGTYSASCPTTPPSGQLEITTTYLPSGTVGQSYSTTLAATGGTQPYTWSLTSGSTLPAGLSLSSSGVISGTPTASTSSAIVMVQVLDSALNTADATFNLDIGTAIVLPANYSFCISSSPDATCSNPSGGYDGVGNVRNYYDSVTGTWSYNYDTLDRLKSGSATDGSYKGLQEAWGIDSFGNRLSVSNSGKVTGTQDNPPGPVPASDTAVYGSNNQLQSTTIGTVTTNYSYDAAGDITYDGRNQYLYDGDGRVCAVHNLTTGAMMGYVYDAEGNRVAKGTLNSWSCDTSSGNFTVSASYILGPGGQQLTEMTWASNAGPVTWAHTNVFAGPAGLAATYATASGTSAPGTLTFYADDWLGSRRFQADYSGNNPEYCSNLPYGDAQTCTTLPTEHLFTGKEHDSESGNDFFMARYYSSAIGRFLSPDWSAKEDPVPYAKLDDPQTLNLYGYMRNNPLGGVDADGHSPCPLCDIVEQIVESPEGQTGEDLGRAGLAAAATTAVALGHQIENGFSSVDWSNFNYSSSDPFPTNRMQSSSSSSSPQGTASAPTGGQSTPANPGPNGPQIEDGKQGKHIPGHNNFQPGKSELTADPKELAQMAGTGQQIGKTRVGLPGSKERVNFGKTIGQYVDPNSGKRTPTSVGIIHYSKKGIHIVPGMP